MRLFLAMAMSLALGTQYQAQAQAESPFKKVPFSALPMIGVEGDLASFKSALERQIAKCLTQDLGATFRFGDRVVTRRKWCVETNQRFLKLLESSKSMSELLAKAADQFDWYQTEGRDGKGEVLFTGYHSPLLEASLTPSAEFSVPLYRRPDDLEQIVEAGKKVWRRKKPDGGYERFHDREAIDLGGALKGKGLEIAYTRDWFDVFILQMEGSGVLLLKQPDGTHQRRFFNYAAQNGHSYVSITQVLREQGVPQEYLSIPGMRKYWKLYPEKMMPTLMRNPSYVFFQFGTDGPFGTDGVKLSPRHSIATDLRIFPQGMVNFLQTQRPLMSGTELVGWQSFSTMTVNQDTGGAIVGPGRVDIYWGDSAYAEQASGRMNHLGSLFIAVAK